MPKQKQDPTASPACLLPAEADRFYRIWQGVLKFANEQRNIAPSLFSVALDEMRRQPIEEILKIRQSIWQDDSILDDFAEQNPFQFSISDLRIAQSWKNRCEGDFYVLKHLKMHSVFIGKDNDVFTVRGLFSPLDEVMGDVVPRMVKAVLLPHEGQIIFDGLLSSYNVFFGDGICASLEDAYRDAQERGRIITSLEAGATATPNADQIQTTNVMVIEAFRKHAFTAGCSEAVVQKDAQQVAQFADVLAALPQPASLRDLTEAHLKNYFTFRQGTPIETDKAAKASAVSLKKFIRFLLDTGRLDYRVAEDMLRLLKTVP